MLKKIVLISFILFTCTSTKAQVNLVLNPSFEQHSQCPYGADQIKFADYWSPLDTVDIDPVCSPEYCNTCATDANVRIPNNAKFFQDPKTGNGLAQVMMFSDEVLVDTSLFYLRDYLQGRFSQPLVEGKSYCVAFYVSLGEFSQNAINHVGAYLDNGSIDSTDTCSLPQTQYIPQVVSQNIINDITNWVKIEGSIIAQGGMRFITIGNFYDHAHTAFEVRANTNHYTWYLIDDVSVIESDLPAYAGDDRAISAGDSTLIGRQPEVGLECVWTTISGSPVGNGGGLWVKPMQTTTYVVAQTLCGVTRNDTVTVYVWGVGINNVPYDKGFTISPNPVKDKFSIHSALYNNETVNVVVYDMSGRKVMAQKAGFDNGMVDVPVSLARGVYLVELNDGKMGKFLQRMVVQ